MPAEGANVYIAGQAKLLGHLLSEEPPPGPGRLKALFQALEDQRILLRLLEQTEVASGIQVFIGAETAVPELVEHTVVAASYGTGEQPVGALGVIGPTRLNYARVIPVVDYTARVVGRVLDGRKGER